MSLYPPLGRWEVRKTGRGDWRVVCPSSGPDGACRCEWFGTHAEAVAYADRWARR